MKNMNLKEITEYIRDDLLDIITIFEDDLESKENLDSILENTYVNNGEIDSRLIGEGDIFFALKGEKTRGENFIESAYKNGGRVFVVNSDYKKGFYKEQKDNLLGSIILITDNSLRALQNLSSKYLEDIGSINIGVTGSVGKTSARDMIYSAVSSYKKTGKNIKNYNSETGMPVTILKFPMEQDVSILEMGMDGFGQIHNLAKIVKPKVGIITNIGNSHMEILGSKEGIKKAKMEITDFFERDSLLIVNGDDPLLKDIELENQGKYRVIKVGTSSSNLDYRVCDIIDKGIDGISFSVLNQGDKFDFDLPLPGSHNAINVAFALVVLGELGISRDLIGASKEIFDLDAITGNRLKVKEFGNIKVIDDSYNAAPISMKAALRTLSRSKGKRKIAVLAGMNELGDDEKLLHKDIGSFVSENKIDILVTLGSKGDWIMEGFLENRDNGEIKGFHFDKKEDFEREFRGKFDPEDLILLKGSRSFELETLNKFLEEEGNKQCI